MTSVEKNELLEQLRDIIQVDPGKRGLASDPVDNLFNVFPDDFASACRSIAEHPSPRVGVVTGFMIPTVDPPTGETDGPPGALLLAEALSHLNIPCVLFSDASSFSALKAGRELLRLNAELIELPMAIEAGLLPPLTHLIALERSGPCRADARNRTMLGRDITDLTAPAHLLFEGPRKYVTIGIGDGGNEIGMGKVSYPTICKNIPNGKVTACRTATDYLIVAGVSNWGAFALAAGIMLHKNSGDASLFDSACEPRVLEHLVEHGPLVDGVTGQRSPTVDGLSFQVYAEPLLRIRSLLEVQ